MDISETSEVIKALNAAASGSETWRQETFVMQRESETHGWQDVTITILDRGPSISPRYAVSAETAGGQRCAGNSGDDLEVVIATVHWYQLDH
ncbi:hypothetical protein [Nocardioides pinisoli]|uniref:Uncharacterized protein n=1 Tax=Nocardioides pinisoli TaxID=2950279 RepID=A0ABT1KYY2_9ACTN|nr:hypothetical protein [Nocardioides pinisoli]MCP3422970.1 hypothetical protein [Nocardioides pinisoli]